MAIRRLSSSGDERPPLGRFFGPRAVDELRNILISIEFKYHSAQKASYRFKRVVIHILSSHYFQIDCNKKILWTFKCCQILKGYYAKEDLGGVTPVKSLDMSRVT